MSILPAQRAPFRPLLAACTTLVLLVASCAPSRSGRDAVETVTVMLPPSERPFWDPVARSFEAAHPGVRVDLIEGPQSTDLRENLYTTSLLARDATFDLVYMDVTWTAKFAAAGWLRPLDRDFDVEARGAFLPAALAAGEYDGHLYRIPVRTDMGVLYFRRDWLEQAGRAPPADFAQLAATARALQSPPGVWGYVWQGKQYEGLVCDFLEVLRGHGGFWVDAETRAVGLDAPQAVAALTFLVDAVRERPFSPPGVGTYQEEESRRLFQDGRAVFLRNWPYAWRLAQAADSPLRGKVGVMPMVHVAGAQSAGTLGGWGLGVSAYSAHAALATEFIRHATTLASQRLLCAPTGYAPALAAAYDDPELLAANAFLKEFKELHEHAVARPLIARYALASDILQRHLSAALSGAEPPARALEAAARETRNMLGPAPAPPSRSRS